LDAGGAELSACSDGRRPKKRQGTKSRDAELRLGVEGYGDFRLAEHMMEARH